MMSPGGKNRTIGRLASACWNMAVHPVSFVVLAILWCLDLGVGSVMAYFRDPGFWREMDTYPFNAWLGKVAPEIFPDSLWIYILVALSWLMVVSLLLCTVNWFIRRKKQLRGLAEFMVHLGFLLIFAGFVVGSAFGVRSEVILQEGKAVRVPEMDVSLMLRQFDVVGPPERAAVDTRSSLVLFPEEGDPLFGTARANHPMIRGSMVVYPPENYGLAVTGGVVGTSNSGAMRLSPGEENTLADGRSLVLGGVLPAGQERGGVVGPGILVLMKGEEGKTIGSAFLSAAPGMRGAAVIGGVGISLGELTRTPRGLYRVHKDPGIRMVIVGTIILALGTIWALAVYFGVVRGSKGLKFEV